MALHLMIVVFAQIVQLLNGAKKVIAGLAHLAHHRLDPLDEAIEGAGQLANLVLTLHLEPLGQIPSPSAMSLSADTASASGLVTRLPTITVTTRVIPRISRITSTLLCSDAYMLLSRSARRAAKSLSISSI